MSYFGNGEITFLIATAYFAVFVAAHALTIVLARHYEHTPPRDADTRVRTARHLGTLHAFRAGWFAVLFTIAGITVIAATPKLPLLEVITVYGGLIGVFVSLMQATDWFRAAARAVRAREALAALTVDSGEITDLVTVQISARTLGRLRSGEALTAAEFEAIRTEPKERAA